MTNILIFILIFIIIIFLAYYMNITSRPITLLGFGGVGTAVIELWPKFGGAPPLCNLTIIEPLDITGHSVLKNIKYTHIKEYLTKRSLEDMNNPATEILYIPNAIVIDCTVNVDALAIMAICHKVGSLYINCSMEDWETDDPSTLKTDGLSLFNRALCGRIWEGHRLFNTGPTMLADQGMNPGIISLYALQGIIDIAKHTNNIKALNFIKKGLWADASEELQVHTIHITERDTQKLNASFKNLFLKEENKFSKEETLYNTWSAVGLLAEALDPIQIGKGIGAGPPTLKEEGAFSIHNMKIYPVRGMDLEQKTHDIIGEFEGYVIPHGEANTLSAKLSKYGYQPTVYFVYRPADFARETLEHMKKNGYIIPKTQVVYQKDLESLSFNETNFVKENETNFVKENETNFVKENETNFVKESETGFGKNADIIGAYIQTPNISWWCGTTLNIKDTQNLGISYSGPTTIQVAAAVLSALKYMLKNPMLGFITPEYLPLSVLYDCAKYIGMHSVKL